MIEAQRSMPPFMCDDGECFPNNCEHIDTCHDMVEGATWRDGEWVTTYVPFNGSNGGKPKKPDPLDQLFVTTKTLTSLVTTPVPTMLPYDPNQYHKTIYSTGCGLDGCKICDTREWDELLERNAKKNMETLSEAEGIDASVLPQPQLLATANCGWRGCVTCGNKKGVVTDIHVS